MHFKFCKKKCILVVLKKKYCQKCKCPMRIRSCIFSFFFWVSWWCGTGAWPCTTCQSCCLGNVENSFDSFLVVTAAGFFSPSSCRDPKKRNWLCFLSLFFCLSRRPLSVSHFSLHVLLSRLQKHLESFIFDSLFVWVVFFLSFFLIVRRDVYFLRTWLFCREPPPVHVMRAFLFLLRVRAFLLEFLTLKFRSSVLKPNFDLSRSRRITKR